MPVRRVPTATRSRRATTLLSTCRVPIRRRSVDDVLRQSECQSGCKTKPQNTGEITRVAISARPLPRTRRSVAREREAEAVRDRRFKHADDGHLETTGTPRPHRDERFRGPDGEMCERAAAA